MANATVISFAQLSTNPGHQSVGSILDLQSFSTEDTVMASQWPTDSIQPTPSSVVLTSFVTSLAGSESKSEDVYNSFERDLTDATQFPMQHATQRSSLEALPAISSVIGLTDFSTIKIPDNDVASKLLSDQPILSSLSEEHPSTSASHSLLAHSQTSDMSSSLMPSSSDLIDQATVDMSVLDLNEGTLYDSSVNENHENTHAKMNIDMTPVLPTVLSDKVLYSSTSDYPSVKLGVNLGTLTPSKTEVLITGVNADTSGPLLYSTPALSFPLPSDPPRVPTSDSGSSSLFGEGGPMNIVLFVGVPVCGLIVLILLVVLVICLRKRKAKKKSPGRAYNQDLWLNTQMEAPLNPTNPSLGNQNKIPVMKKIPQKAGMRKVKVDQLYEVICDFPGGEDSQLRLRKGDMVKVETREENGWWRGSVGEAAGWFPGSYVEHIQQNSDELSHEEEVQKFLLSDGEGCQERQVSSFMLKKKREQSGGFTGEIQSGPIKEPIYSKIDKNKIHKVSVPKIPEKPPKHPAIILGESSSTPLADGCKFRAVYSYSPQFKGEICLVKGELIKGIEKDRNGWMRGIKESTGEDGWFPAVYVDEIKEAVEDKDTVSQIYKALDINKSALRGQDLVGIPHQVLYNFTAEKPGDLSLKAGDSVTVVQTLENGWFLGCKGQNVGWFPKSFVEIIDQSKEITKESIPEKEQSVFPMSLNVTEKLDVPSTKEGIMQSRKAPPTSLTKIPVSPGSSKIPKFGQRPARPAPAPPVSTGGKETQLDSYSKENSDGKMLGPDKTNTEASFQENHSKKELNDEQDQKEKASPPAIPKRFVKPNLVKIPQTDALSSLAKESPSRPPPPPRPCPPKLGTPKISAICHREDSASASEDEHYFSVKPHRKFDIGIPKPPSQEEVENENNKTHLSTFGKVNGEVTPESTKQSGLLSSPEKKVESFQAKGPSTRCIPKLTKQKKVDETESPTSSLNGYPVMEVTNDSGDICKDEVELSNECANMVNGANQTFDKFRVSELDLSDDERVTITVKDLPSKLPQFKKSIAKPVLGDINSEKDSEPQVNDSGFEDKSETESSPVTNGTDMVPEKAKFRDINGNEDSVSDSDVTCQEPVRYHNDSPIGASKAKPKVASKPKPKVLPKPKVYGSHNRQEEPTMVHTENSPLSATSGNVSDIVSNEQEKTKIPVFRSSPVLESDSMESSGNLDHSLTVDGFPSRENSDSVMNEENLCENQNSCISKTDDSVLPGSLHDHADKPVPKERTAKQQKPLDSLRQRSNSPHGRTSIPTPKSRQRSSNSDSKDSPGSSLRTRSSSPSSRSGIPAITSRQVSESPNAKKKIGSSIPGPRSKSPAMTKSTRSPKNVSSGNDLKDRLKEEDGSDAAIENNKHVSKLQKPSKISKGGDGSQSSKAPKQGKSLLPVIQKSLSSDQGSGVKVKSASGIPVSRPPRPPPPKSPKSAEEKSELSTVKQAVKGHQAHSEEELSFEVGSIITEISGCDRAGWCVGMLEDGTTGLYPINHVKTAENQNEA
ncbi:hypothetical protein CHS0354_005854 [Potamilus streckersoni]|uniref:SH3 domain-containing protein n=1 Tax=Potamilus streckersoni TaxID=2493646 RepID=A0AAE0TAN3_9BIVA|nr:hypothetical protein CHS0354_005854 [Potamilus streckersoni]